MAKVQNMWGFIAILQHIMAQDLRHLGNFPFTFIYYECYTVANSTIIMNDNLSRILTEATVVYFTVLPQHFPRGTGKS
jgi:hypothetical protein